MSHHYFFIIYFATYFSLWPTPPPPSWEFTRVTGESWDEKHLGVGLPEAPYLDFTYQANPQRPALLTQRHSVVAPSHFTNEQTKVQKVNTCSSSPSQEQSQDLNSAWFQAILILLAVFHIPSYQEGFIYDTKSVPVLNCCFIIFSIKVLVPDVEIM